MGELGSARGEPCAGAGRAPTGCSGLRAPARPLLIVSWEHKKCVQGVDINAFSLRISRGGVKEKKQPLV